MLAFLESLCEALIARDTPRILALLSHPLARALPRAVRDEARAIAAGDARHAVTPLRTLRLYHQTAQLLGGSSDPATPKPASGGSRERRQMELPLQRVAAP